MEIVEYKNVDPLQVLNLTLLALDFPLTPELAMHLRRTDPRFFPCFTINAVEKNWVLGQLGIFRLPVVSAGGREDIGGVWAVSTHPLYAEHGVVPALLEEAHSRLRAAGMRFSTMGINRSTTLYQLFQKHGYVDMNIWATALARWEVAHQPTRLRAQTVGEEGYAFIDRIFENLSGEYLGFAWRHQPFMRLRDKVGLEDIWVVWENSEPVGYVFASKNELILKIDIQLLRIGTQCVDVIAAVASRLKTSYVQVTMNRPSDIAILQRAGWLVTHPAWNAFMVKPLLPESNFEETRRLFGLGTDRFLISWLDTA